MKIITLAELRNRIDFDLWEIEANTPTTEATYWTGRTRGMRARALQRLRRCCERHSDLGLWPDLIFMARRLLRLDRGGIKW